MSGTVLSTLCSICHTEPPKYKCPGCGARTCSVPCIQKHKARADCDGVRNPRAFMPLSQLKTAAGIDHDFNFLTSIERARQRVEKDVVEARRLLSEKELRPRNEDKLFQKVWYGDELRHVPVHSQPYKKHGLPQERTTFIDGFDKHVRRRLRYLDIDVLTMPKGMARPRQNRTAFNRRTQTINWQVEWLVYSAPQLGLPVEQSQQPLRILYKSLEGTPLHSALASTLDWRRGQLDRQSREQHDPAETDNEADADDSPIPRKKRKTHHNHSHTKNKQLAPLACPTQDLSTSTWPAAAYTAQYPLTSAWSQTTTSAHIETTLEEQLTSWQFFLLHAARPSPTIAKKPPPNSKILIPLSPTETLTTILSGRTVIEFPTIYALPAGEGLPEGCVVENIPRRAPRSVVQSEARGEALGDGNRNGNSRKRGLDEWWGDNNLAGPARARGSGQGQGRGEYGYGHAASGRGGKRVKFDGGRTPAREGTEAVEEEGEESEAEEGGAMSEVEEGEVGSDGEEVMVDGGMVDIDGETESEEEIASSETLREDEEEGEIVEARGGKPTGGLVDYWSSDEDD